MRGFKTPRFSAHFQDPKNRRFARGVKPLALARGGSEQAIFVMSNITLIKDVKFSICLFILHLNFLLESGLQKDWTAQLLLH